jgi:hypothetical protein
MIIVMLTALSAMGSEVGSKADRATLGVENIGSVSATRIRRFGDTFKVKVTPRQLEVYRIPKAFVNNFGPVQQEEIRQVARELAGECTLLSDQFDLSGRLASKLDCPQSIKPVGLKIVAAAQGEKR